MTDVLSHGVLSERITQPVWRYWPLQLNPLKSQRYLFIKMSLMLTYIEHFPQAPLSDAYVITDTCKKSEGNFRQKTRQVSTRL